MLKQAYLLYLTQKQIQSTYRIMQITYLPSDLLINSVRYLAAASVNLFPDKFKTSSLDMIIGDSQICEVTKVRRLAYQ